ncbi:MAG: ribonuclease HII [Desulfurococcales archaeon]|nr:ribonuclease HII [Desulfurococcales archaeon]
MSKWIIGVDEAGRGSLIGEMIVAGYAVKVSDLDKLVELGVRDSKELSRASRRELYRILASMGVYTVYPVPPERIDSENLVDLTEEAIIAVIGYLGARIGVSGIERITIDKYGRERGLKTAIRGLGCDCRIVVEEKADSRYPEVSAASIIAKHVRDERIRVLRSIYGVRGSGYPGDRETVEWVMEVLSRGNRLPIIRYSWETLEGTGYRIRKYKGRRLRTLDEFL